MTATGRVRTGCLLAPVLLVGCAAQPPAAPPADGHETEYHETEYTVTTTVLESPDHGPQLCLGGVMESYPPQCGGPDVDGFDWAEVDGEESASGTTWGTFDLTGTWDGETLTLTAPPEPGVWPEPDHPVDPFASPCDPPSGGWAVVDPSLASEADMEAAIGYARSQPSHAGVWLDQLVDQGEERPFDAAEVVLNLRFTADADEHERAVGELWGGPVCVIEGEHTMADLEAVQQRLHRDLDDVLTSGIDEPTGTVHITLPVVDERLRGELRERYGELVRAEGMLRPVE